MTTGWIDLSNCNIDDIKHATMTILGWNKPIYIFYDFPLSFSVFKDTHEYANYANMITCIFDHGIKGVCLSINLVQILIIYG